MVELAYYLLAAVVGLGGIALAVFAFVGLPFQSSAGLDLLRTRARWAYVAIAILSFVISMGDLPRYRRDADLLWVVPGNIPARRVGCAQAGDPARSPVRIDRADDRLGQARGPDAGGRAANDEVVAFMRDHLIVELWGEGLFASADMTSLDATRHLWAARLDPRRRTFAVGSYTHVLDQWGIVYDQPILLNRRQAGAAIEGALRQQHVVELERVAVDTHGHTHVAMALAKLTGFDLCPRLAQLKTRKLYLPRGLAIPDVLRPIVVPTISRRAIARGWDGLTQLAASVHEGFCPATEALERYGAAARGDPVHTAAEALGKLLRTVYLCDYLGSPDFRSEILALLNQGESLHSLQRAIQQGPIGARRGRTTQQLTAISGALALLTNLVMAWNTRKMQAMHDRTPARYHDALIASTAPTTHRHINMRGILAFELAEHRQRLLPQARPLWTAERRVARS